VTEEALFHEALAVPPDRRATYLADRCPDPELRQRVEGLLAAHDRPAGPLDAAPQTGAFVPDAEPVPTHVGPYKLLQRLGEGGMGEVWVADQERPVKRRVALKLVKPGMDSAQVLRRFEAERQALALMDHTNIAKVLDAGTVAGKPYFVMELVKGVPITRYCDELHLSVRERLGLFVPVCQAIQHAHQKGVIHRDIKPSNVLVAMQDGKPVPKVIDFGVAKALHQRLTEQSMYTEIGAVIGTLEYMSPEQAELSALDVDTRADVYALGVLLYELLTGTTPLDRKRLRSAAFVEMLRIIKEEEPPRPSTRLTQSHDSLASLAARRRTEPARLAKEVRGELDWIVMKALEKDRTRRYETADGLARDVERHLADEPVEACPPAATYRVRKFVRRNTGPVIAAAAVGLVLAGGIVGTTWALVEARRQRDAAEAERVQADAARADAEKQRDEANRERRRARAALDDMLGDTSKGFLTAQKELLPEQKAFLEGALKHYQELAAHAATDEEGRELIGGAQLQLASIHATLGRLPEAETALRAGIATQEKLVADFPAQPRHLYPLARGWNNLAMTLAHLGQHAEADAAYRAAITIVEKLAADAPTEPGHRWNLARAHTNRATSLSVMGRYEGAESELRAALAIQQHLVADFPAAAEQRSYLAVIHMARFHLLRTLGRSAEAEAAARAALALDERLVLDVPANHGYRKHLAEVRGWLGLLLSTLHRTAEAEASVRAALAIDERLAADFPADPGFRSALAGDHQHLATALDGAGKGPEAAAELRMAVVISERLAREYPADPTHRSDLGISHTDLGRILARAGQRAAAEAEYRAAIDILARLAADYPGNVQHGTLLGTAYLNLGALFGNAGESAAALEWLEKAIAALEPIRRSNPTNAFVRPTLVEARRSRGLALIALGRPAVAEFDRALDLDDGTLRTDLRQHRAVALARSGETDAARGAADELAAMPGLGAGGLYDAACVYALVSGRLHPADANRVAATAVATLRRAVAAGYRDVRHMTEDSDLAAVRGRADFAALLWDLADTEPEAAP
jgi:serine/threonine protein kinase